MIRSFDRHSSIAAESFWGVNFDRHMGFGLRWAKIRLIHLMPSIILVKYMKDDDLRNTADCGGCGGSCPTVMDHRCHMGKNF